MESFWVLLQENQNDSNILIEMCHSLGCFLQLEEILNDKETGFEDGLT